MNLATDLIVLAWDWARHMRSSASPSYRLCPLFTCITLGVRAAVAAPDLGHVVGASKSPDYEFVRFEFPARSEHGIIYSPVQVTVAIDRRTPSHDINTNLFPEAHFLTSSEYKEAIADREKVVIPYGVVSGLINGKDEKWLVRDGIRILAYDDHAYLPPSGVATNLIGRWAAGSLDPKPPGAELQINSDGTYWRVVRSTSVTGIVGGMRDQGRWWATDSRLILAASNGPAAMYSLAHEGDRMRIRPIYNHSCVDFTPRSTFHRIPMVASPRPAPNAPPSAPPP